MNLYQIQYKQVLLLFTGLLESQYFSFLVVVDDGCITKWIGRNLWLFFFITFQTQLIIGKVGNAHRKINVFYAKGSYIYEQIVYTCIV